MISLLLESIPEELHVWRSHCYTAAEVIGGHLWKAQDFHGRTNTCRDGHSDMRFYFLSFTALFMAFLFLSSLRRSSLVITTKLYWGGK